MSEFELSVRNAMDAFHRGLIALIPSAELEGITWRDENTHDDWERLAESLFDVFVGTPMCQDSGTLQNPYPLPRYDFDLASYAELSWLEMNSSSEDVVLAFVRFLTRNEPFDTVQFAELALDGRVLGSRITVPCGDVSFRLRKRFPDGSFQIVSEVFLVE